MYLLLKYSKYSPARHLLGLTVSQKATCEWQHVLGLFKGVHLVYNKWYVALT